MPALANAILALLIGVAPIVALMSDQDAPRVEPDGAIVDDTVARDVETPLVDLTTPVVSLSVLALVGPGEREFAWVRPAARDGLGHLSAAFFSDDGLRLARAMGGEPVAVPAAPARAGRRVLDALKRLSDQIRTAPRRVGARLGSSRLDFNADGATDALDVPIFLHAMANRTPAAEMNADGRVDVRDLLDFIEGLEARGAVSWAW